VGTPAANVISIHLKEDEIGDAKGDDATNDEDE
jgi:hypothetical protein